MVPRWFSWVFLIAIGYLVVTGSAMRETAPRSPGSAAPVINAQTYPALAQLTDVEGWKRAIDPQYAANMNCALDAPGEGLAFTLIKEQPGKGPGAQCGETIMIALTVWNTAGKSGYKSSLPLTLGHRDLAAGFDYGLLGLAVGGERTILLPPYTLTRGKASEATKELVPAIKALPSGKLAIVTVTRLK